MARNSAKDTHTLTMNLREEEGKYVGRERIHERSGFSLSMRHLVGEVKRQVVEKRKRGVSSGEMKEEDGRLESRIRRMHGKFTASRKDADGGRAFQLVNWVRGYSKTELRMYQFKKTYSTISQIVHKPKKGMVPNTLILFLASFFAL